METHVAFGVLNLKQYVVGKGVETAVMSTTIAHQQTYPVLSSLINTFNDIQVIVGETQCILYHVLDCLSDSVCVHLRYCV